MKKIKEIFNDYEQNSNIKNAEIQSMNLIKRTNVLELEIKSDEYIEIKDLWFFEKFLRERFKFANVDIKIDYTDNVTIKEIEKEWTNLIAYMVHKYPLMKPMILLKSTIKVNKKDIDVNMKIKGADFLRGRKLDRELERVIKNLFNLDYKINFIEVLDSEEEKKLKEKLEFNQNQAIEMALEHMQLGEKIAEERKEKSAISEGNLDMSLIPVEEPPIVEMPLEEEQQTPLIYGKNSNFKGKLINIVDISPEDDMATISGEILERKYRRKRIKKWKILNFI